MDNQMTDIIELQHGGSVAQEKSNLELMIDVANKRPELRKMLNEARAGNSAQQGTQSEHKFIMDMYFSYDELDLTIKDTDSIYLKGVKQLIKVIKDEESGTQAKLYKARHAIRCALDCKTLTGDFENVEATLEQALKDIS